MAVIPVLRTTREEMKRLPSSPGSLSCPLANRPEVTGWRSLLEGEGHDSPEKDDEPDDQLQAGVLHDNASEEREPITGPVMCDACHECSKA